MRPPPAHQAWVAAEAATANRAGLLRVVAWSRSLAAQPILIVLLHFFVIIEPAGVPVKQQFGDLVQLVDLVVEVDFDLVWPGGPRAVLVVHYGIPEALTSLIFAVEPVQQLS